MNRRTLFSVIGGLFAGAALPKVASAGDVFAVAKRYSDDELLKFCCGNKDAERVGDAILRLYKEGVSEIALRRMTESMICVFDYQFIYGWRELLSERLSVPTARKIAATLGLDKSQHSRTLEVCGNLLRERYKFHCYNSTEVKEARRALEMWIGIKVIPDAGVRLSLSKEQVQEIVEQELESLLATKKAEYLRLGKQPNSSYIEKIVG